VKNIKAKFITTATIERKSIIAQKAPIPSANLGIYLCCIIMSLGINIKNIKLMQKQMTDPIG